MSHEIVQAYRQGPTPRQAATVREGRKAAERFSRRALPGEGDWVNSGAEEGVDGGRKSYAGEQAETTHD